MNYFLVLWCECACLRLNDKLTLQTASASLKQLQPTLHVKFKQTVMDPLLALDKPRPHCYSGFFCPLQTNSAPTPATGQTGLALDKNKTPGKWCPRADLNHRHADFQSAALPLSYSGYTAKPRGSAAYREAIRPLASAKSVYVVSAKTICIIRRWAGHAIALIQPFHQIAILAPLTAKRFGFRLLWLPT